MADIGDLNDTLMQSQNTIVLTADTAGGDTADDRIVSITFAQTEDDRPEQRSNYGTAKVYHYGSPDRAFYFIADANENLLSYLNARFTENARNVPPSFPWEIRSTSNDGTVVTTKFEGPLITKRFLPNIENQGEVAAVEVRVRIPGAITIT